MTPICQIRRLLSLFGRRERRGLYALAAGMIMAGLLEIAGIASIIPFLALLANPEASVTHPALSIFYQGLGFESSHAFFAAVGGVVLVIIVATNAFAAFFAWRMALFSSRVQFDLSFRLLRRYLAKPYSFFLQRNTSGLINDVQVEVRTIVGGLLSPMILLFANAVVMLAIIILLLIVDPLLTLAAAVVVGAAFGATYALTRSRLSRLGIERRELTRRAQQALMEVLGGIRDVKLAGKESVFLDGFGTPSQRLAMQRAKIQVYSNTPYYLIQTIVTGGIIIGLIVLLSVYQRSFESVLPTLGTFAFATLRLMPAVQGIYTNLVTLKYSAAALEVLHSELAAGPAEDGSEEVVGTDPVPKLTKAIELRHVRYRYEGSDAQVLDDVSLTIPAFARVGIVGSTGAGKSTLIDVLAGLLPPVAGSVFVDGCEITLANVRSWQAQIGYVPQAIYLSDGTIRQNIAFGVGDEVDEQRAEAAARVANIHDFIVSDAPAGYDTLVGERGVRLSGGQRQRLGIARALYRDVRLLILDEATSAVDNVTERAVMKALANAARNHTVIMIAHRLSTVKDCDVIFYMEQGRLKDSGSYDNLLEVSSGFRALVEAATHEAGHLL